MSKELQEHKENCIKLIILSKNELKKGIVPEKSFKATIDWVKRQVQSLFWEYFVFMDDKIKVDNLGSIFIDISKVDNNEIESIVKNNMDLFDEVLFPNVA